MSTATENLSESRDLAKAPDSSSRQEPVVQKRAELSPVRKAALVLLSLDPEQRNDLLRHLSEDEAETVLRQVAQLPRVPAETVRGVLEEFCTMREAYGEAIEGGVDRAKAVLTAAYGAQPASVMVERILRSLGSETDNLIALQQSDPRQLAKLIYGEHPQVIAMVLSHLSAKQGAELLLALPEEIRMDVAVRMAQLDQFSPEVVERLASYIGRRLKSLGEFSRKTNGGVRALAEIMNRLDNTASNQILGQMDEKAASISESVRQLMFVFDDLLKLTKPDMLAIIGKVDRKVLMLALKGATEQVKKHFTQCMSQRAVEMLDEEIQTMGAVRIKEIDSARAQVIAVVRQLQAEGVIDTQGADGGYVD